MRKNPYGEVIQKKSKIKKLFDRSVTADARWVVREPDAPDQFFFTEEKALQVARGIANGKRVEIEVEQQKFTATGWVAV